MTGAVAGHEDFKDGFEAFDDGATLTGADRLAKAWSGSAFAQFGFDAVELAHEAEDLPAVFEGCSLLGLFFDGGFGDFVVLEEAAADVGEAAHEDDLDERDLGGSPNSGGMIFFPSGQDESAS